MNMIGAKTLWERCKELGEKRDPKTVNQDVFLVFEHDEYIFLYDGNVLARVSEKSVQGSQWLAEAILTKFEGDAMLDKFGKALRESRKAERIDPVISYYEQEAKTQPQKDRGTEEQIQQLLTYVLDLGRKGAKQKGFEYNSSYVNNEFLTEVKSLREEWGIDFIKIGRRYFLVSPFDFTQTCEMLGFAPKV